MSSIDVSEPRTPSRTEDVLDVAAIRLSARVQQRVEMNMAMVGEYAESMQRDDVFPPIDVFYDGEDYWLADGFHRVEAIRADIAELESEKPRGMADVALDK